MVFPSGSLQAHFSVPVRVKPSKTTNYGASSAASLSFRGNSLQNYRLTSKSLMRLKRLSFARCAGETTSMTMDCSSEQTSSFDSLSDHATETVMDDEEEGEEEGLDYHELIRVCDKLITVFLVDKPAPADWRRLLAFSQEWNNIRPHFFRRCQERADTEDNPEMKGKLLRLQRKLKVIDEDVQRHNELIDVIKATPSGIPEIVSRRRKDFTEEFFMHFHAVVHSYNEDPTEQNALSELGNMCLDAVQAYDTACGEVELLNAAQLKFEDIINSPLDVACKKIDSLAERNQLDSALALMVTKAWASAKDTSVVKEEVKDILYYLYEKMRDSLQRQLPKEIRILKYILMLEDPEEQIGALREAFTQDSIITNVEELETEGGDILYTTPETFHSYMKDVVNAYNLSLEGSSLLLEARALMDPEMILKIEKLIRLVEKNFM